MTELDRVGRSDNFNFRGFPSFLHACKKLECLHGDGSALYL